MGLFLDTTNKKFVIALINNGIVTHFEMKDTEQRVAKYANKWIKEFLKKTGVKLEELENFYITKGPGSFTGVKVGLNFFQTLALVNNIEHINTIDTLELLRIPGYNNVALSFGKGKYYIRKNHRILFKKNNIKYTLQFFIKGFKVTNELPKVKEGKYFTFGKTQIDYFNFNKDILQMKLKKFRKEKIESVKLIYPKIKY